MRNWFLPLFLTGIALGNTLMGLYWSRLDRNPWADRPLGGFFSRSGPGILPGRLSVAEINRRGRLMLWIGRFALPTCGLWLLADFAISFVQE